MSVSIVSEPKRWFHRVIGNCRHQYVKSFTVQAASKEAVNWWAADYSKRDHMVSRGNCGETKWATEAQGDLFAVNFIYEVDSGD